MSVLSAQLSKQIQNPEYHCKYIPIKVLSTKGLLLQLAINLYKWNIKLKYHLCALAAAAAGRNLIKKTLLFPSITSSVRNRMYGTSED